MSSFDNTFNSNILPRYERLFHKHNDTPILTTHKYALKEREDLTGFPSYIIDPKGSTDADDGFFIYSTSDDEYMLGIVIADPTHYFNTDSDIFRNALQNTQTFYPSKTEPFHLMPNEVLNKASLLPNDETEIKLAMVLLCNVNKENNLPYNPNIIPANVRVSKRTSFSYQEASQLIDDDITIMYGVNIGQASKYKRTNGFSSMSDLKLSTPTFIDNKAQFVNDVFNVCLCKEMIAEFAIYFNSYVGNLLTNYYSRAIFRTYTHTHNQTSDPKEILREIINDGKSAKYQSQKHNHSLVNVESYTHFTSPLRRVSDLIAHYLLKSALLEESSPFPIEELNNYSEIITQKGKNLKKIYYDDNKLRCLEAISNMHNEGKEVVIYFRYTQYTGLFANFMIEKINEFDVSVSTSFRIPNFTNIIEYNTNPFHTIKITRIGKLTKFDSDILPEMYNYIVN